MIRPIRFLEVYQDIFFAGKNFGKKLTPKTIDGLEINFDEEKDWFVIKYRGRCGFTKQNSAFWEFEDAVVVAPVKNEHQTQDVKKIKSAQVSTPHGHVFQGEGAGVVRDR